VGRILERGGVVEFFGSTLTLPVERRFADVASVQRYVDTVMRVLADEGLSLPPVRIRERAGHTRAHYEAGARTGQAVIAVPLQLVHGRRWAARESVVLHELAHHITAHDDRAREDSPHGAIFCGHLLALHERVIGPESALLLRAEWTASGIPIAESIPS
jgi:putative metallohydrolase (TIGR04338 family)